MQRSIKTQLTPSILKFFINAGYEYCLSRFSYADKEVSSITITPVKRPQDIPQLKADEALFLASAEPLEMLRSKDGPPVQIEFESDRLAHLICYLSNGRSKLNTL